MPLLENTDRDSFLTSPVALAAKLRFKPENTSSWNATDMTSPCDYATSSSTASSTFLWTTLKHLALPMDKVLSWHGFLEQKYSLCHLSSSSIVFLLSILFSLSIVTFLI